MPKFHLTDLRIIDPFVHKTVVCIPFPFSEGKVLWPEGVRPRMQKSSIERVSGIPKSPRLPLIGRYVDRGIFIER
jgi:hypothetical protein